MTAHDSIKPQVPAEPDPADCCGSGCVRCIFDLHEDAVLRYREALAKWEKQLFDRGADSSDA
ncbi:MAG: oxidoreductase-like domain-containing protein [Dokdonella sp.]